MKSADEMIFNILAALNLLLLDWEEVKRSVSRQGDFIVTLSRNSCDSARFL